MVIEVVIRDQGSQAVRHLVRVTVAAPTQSCPPIVSIQLFKFMLMIVAVADRLMKLNGRKDTGGAGRFGLLPTLTDNHTAKHPVLIFEVSICILFQNRICF